MAVGLLGFGLLTLLISGFGQNDVAANLGLFLPMTLIGFAVERPVAWADSQRGKYTALWLWVLKAMAFGALGQTLYIVLVVEHDQAWYWSRAMLLPLGLVSYLVKWFVIFVPANLKPKPAA